MKLPKIKANLLVQDLDDEVLIYDKTTNKSYCLNDTAKTVFNACDGKKTFGDLKLPEDIIYLSLDELKKNDLIQSDYVSPFAGMNRREVIRKVGLASMIMLPVISSLIAPVAASAASATCTPGRQGDVFEGNAGQGDDCLCGQSSQNNGGFRLCNTTRGGNPFFGCKEGCICGTSSSSSCGSDGTCLGTCR